MYYYARLICKASVYKLVSELFLATSCLLYADTVPLRSIIYVSYFSMHYCAVLLHALNFSLRRQVAAINKMSAAGLFFWDYGNAFLLESSRAGIRIIVMLLHNIKLITNEHDIFFYVIVTIYMYMYMYMYMYVQKTAAYYFPLCNPNWGE